MKKHITKLSHLFALIILFSPVFSLYAQRGLGQGYGRGPGQGLGLELGQGLGLRNNVLGGQGFLYGIPDLTEEQESRIIELRTAYLLELNEVQNQLAEKQVQFNILNDAEESDMEAISKYLDEMSKLRNQLILQGITFNKDIRDLLNDEQKVFFDSGNFRCFNRNFLRSDNLRPMMRRNFRGPGNRGRSFNRPGYGRGRRF